MKERDETAQVLLGVGRGNLMLAPFMKNLEVKKEAVMMSRIVSWKNDRAEDFSDPLPIRKLAKPWKLFRIFEPEYSRIPTIFLRHEDFRLAALLQVFLPKLKLVNKPKKLNLCYSRDITPKRVTKGGIHLRDLAPELERGPSLSRPRHYSFET